MKKGMVISEKTVGIIIILIGLVILIYFLFPGIIDFLAGAGDILETETVPVVVDKGMLERSANNVVFYKGKTYGDVQTMLEKFMDMPSDSSENILVRQYYDPYYENSKYRWAFAKIVADRLYECSLKTVYKADQLTELFAITETGPTKCIVCYNIHVAPDARDMLKRPEGDTITRFGLAHWLSIYSPKKQKETYYDLITAGFRFPAGLPETSQWISQHSKFDRILLDPEDDIAVVFVHVPLIGGSVARIPGVYGDSGNVDFVSLYSFKNLADTRLVSFERDFAGIDILAEDVDARCGR